MVNVTARDHLHGMKRSIEKLLDGVRPWRAKVTTDNGDGTYLITPAASNVELAEKMGRIKGFTVFDGGIPEAEVAVLPLGGSHLVLGKIDDGLGTEEFFDFPLVIRGDFSVLNDTDTAFGVDTSLNTVGIADGFSLKGFNPTEKWSIDGNGNLIAASFNSPLIHTEAASTATNSSTTSTATYVSALTDPITLPTGTWTVYCIGGVSLTHSTGGTVNMLITINGNDGTARAMTAPTAPHLPIMSEHIVTGVSGSFNAVVNYKSNTAGTTAARNPWLLTVATRTA